MAGGRSVLGNRNVGAHGARRRRSTADSSEAAARALFAAVGRSGVCAALRVEHRLDYRFLDDRALLHLLARSYRTGLLSPALGAEAGSAVWARLDANFQGLGRVILGDDGTQRGGFVRIPYEELPDPQAVVQHILAHRQARAAAASFLADTHGGGRGWARGDGTEMAAALLAALAAGVLALFRQAGGGAGEGGKEEEDDAPPAPSAPSKPLQKVVHWIEIVLVDEDGAPLAGEAYEITLPSGAKRAGALDSNGKARLDGLTEGGSAQVCFPAIDGREWRVA